MKKSNKIIIYQAVLCFTLCISILMITRTIVTQFYIVKDIFFPFELNYENTNIFQLRLLTLKLVPLFVLPVIYFSATKGKKRIIRRLTIMLLAIIVFLFLGDRIIKMLSLFSSALINSTISLVIFGIIFIITYRIIKANISNCADW